MEILAVTPRPGRNLVAFGNTGTVKWVGDQVPVEELGKGAIALGDLDADGDVEIVLDSAAYDHKGKTLWAKIPPGSWGGGEAGLVSATTLADLDGDGKLEVIFGGHFGKGAAYHHDGSLYFKNGPEDKDDRAYPQVANLDDDPEPEIFIIGKDGIFILEHTGAVKASLPVAKVSKDNPPFFPATAHDFDGDNVSDFGGSSGVAFSAYRRDGTVLWSKDVVDVSGYAGGTAFDFLGSAAAQAMYADETNLFVWDGKTGKQLMKVPRSSATLIEYPVVADIDNDGAAEVLVVSNALNHVPVRTAPTLQAIKDKEERWVQARRIWNQHTYHVTNVREDGTIPKVEPPNWKSLNTFRTQAQIDGGRTCKPCGATVGCK